MEPEVKVCSVGGETKPLSEFYKKERCIQGVLPMCKEHYNEQQKNNRENNPELKEKARIQSAKWYENNKERHALNAKAWYDKNKDSSNKRSSKWHYDLVVSARNIYGGKCVNCGSENNLEFDHVNDDGKAHREIEPRTAMLTRIVTLGEPIQDWELQLLCCCCHWDKTMTNKIKGTPNSVKRKEIRVKAIEIYGGCCNNCGETERLAFDHVNGGGDAHRKIEGDATMLHRIVRTNDRLPDVELQLLCCCCHKTKTHPPFDPER